MSIESKIEILIQNEGRSSLISATWFVANVTEKKNDITKERSALSSSFNCHGNLGICWNPPLMVKYHESGGSSKTVAQDYQ